MNVNRVNPAKLHFCRIDAPKFVSNNYTSLCKLPILVNIC